MKIKSQSRAQSKLLSSPSDICIYGEFAGGGARGDDRDKLGGRAGVECGGDAVEFDGVGGEGGGEVGAGDGHAVAHRAAGRGEGGDGGGGRCGVDGREGDGDLGGVRAGLIAGVEGGDGGVVGARGGHAEGGAGCGGDGTEGDGVWIDTGGGAPEDTVAGEIRLGAGVPGEGAVLDGRKCRRGEEPDGDREDDVDH